LTINQRNQTKKEMAKPYFRSMKKLFLLAFFCVIFSSVYSQVDTLRTGAYRNRNEFKNHNPSFNCDFTFTKKDDIKIPELYKVTSKNHRLKNNIINKEIWCIYDGDHFYLNAMRIGMKKGFIRFESHGKYLYFQGIAPRSLSQDDAVLNSTMAFGLAGWAVSNAIINSQNKQNNLFVYSTATGMINYLTLKFVALILRPYAELSMKFELEEHKDSAETLVRYLDLINEQNEIGVD
jgi:hypothetical protein